jgi:hypothetical protein
LLNDAKAAPCHTLRKCNSGGAPMRSVIQAPIFAVTVFAAGVLAFAFEAKADRRSVDALGQNLPQPGTSFDDVRAIKLPDGQKLVCDSDAEKPRLDQPKFMDPPSNHGPVRVRRCAVFAPGAGDVWHLGQVPSVAGPARLWMIFVEQGIGGRFRLAQFSLWAKLDGWDKIATALIGLQGPSTAGTDRFLSWQDDQTETTMFIDEKNPDEFAVSVGDVRLRRLLKSPGTNYRSE